MTPRALTEQEAITAEQWFSEYERVGTFRSKATELGVDPHTLRDAIARVRGQKTRYQPKRKAVNLEELVNQLTIGTSGTIGTASLHVEPPQKGEKDCQEVLSVTR